MGCINFCAVFIIYMLHSVLVIELDIDTVIQISYIQFTV